MAIDLQNSQNIATGWGPPPKLDAPNIAGVLGEILQQRRWQQAQTQKNIADAIKNVRQERQSAEYLDAAKEAGLIPQDYEAGGVGGAALGGTLAKQIMAQKVADARAGLIGAQTEKAQTIADYIKQHGHTPGTRGSGGDGSGEPADASGPEIIEHNGVQYQVIRTRNGIRYQRVPYQRPVTPTREEVENTAPTLPGQTVYPDEPAAAPEPSPAETGDMIQTSKVQPTTDGADKNLAPSYGVRPSPAILIRARQALDDPEATEEEKAQARKILGQ